MESLMADFELVVAEEYKFEYWAKWIQIAFYQNFRTVTTLMQRTQIIISSVENFFANKKLSMPTLMPDGR